MTYQSRILDKRVGIFNKKDFNKLLVTFKKSGYFTYKKDFIAGCNEIDGEKVPKNNQVFGAVLMHGLWNVIFYKPDLIQIT